MKRVRLIATIIPAIAGVTIPGTAAMAASGAMQVINPDTANKCQISEAGIKSACIGVHGTGNDVNTASDYSYTKAGTAYLGYRDVPGFPAKSKWKTGALANTNGNWHHHWSPQCSFATGAQVYGWTNYHTTKQVVTIAGSNYTTLHKCP